LSTRGDLCPAAVCAALAPLQDAVPPMPPAAARAAVAAELASLGLAFDDVFLAFADVPLGSASVAQVHRATLRGAQASRPRDVAVKVQHEGAEALMALDLADLAALAYALQRTELRFDLTSAVAELRAQVAQEFDFGREARCMDNIAARLAPMRRRLAVPRSVAGLVTRRMLVMDFLDGIPLTRLAERAGGGAAARAASGRVLGALAEAYGRMLFTQGPFQADPHRARPASHMALLPACLPACFARHSRAARSAASQPVRLLVCSPAVGAAASPSAARDAR
jgi:predicted unusual protein kinase regulating ubiquinone biosynthesis (AarF/ABC1/UbiB family)